MPYLTLKRVTVEDGWNECPWEFFFIIEGNARDKLKHEIEHLKTNGVIFDVNTGPNIWRGKYPNGTNVVVSYDEQPFHDRGRLHVPEITIYD